MLIPIELTIKVSLVVVILYLGRKKLNWMLLGYIITVVMFFIGRLVEGESAQGVSFLWWLHAWSIDGRIIGPLWMVGAVIVSVLEFKRIGEQKKRSA